MELILLILKIILIAFGVLLGLIILALGLILFVPIRYEVSGSVGDSWEMRIKGKVSYLLSIFKLMFFYEEREFHTRFFLFGFEKKLQEDTEPETETADAEAEITIHKKKTQSVPEEKQMESHDATEEYVEPDITEELPQEEETEPEKVAQRPEEPKRAKAKKEKKPKNTLDFAWIKQELTDEHNKSVLRKVWSELGYLLKHFKLRRIVTDLVFATGDPATTGQVLGVLCMIPALYRYDFKIVPDFEAEEPYLKGTFLIAGKIRLIHILMTALRLIFDKEVRIVVKKILKVLEQ